jgi:transposase InsO family protein
VSAKSAVNDRRLTLKALDVAVQRRWPEPGLLHHSDRGCTYTCEDYQTYRFPSDSEAKMALFDYIEVFYNQRQRHSTLGQISPAAFERRAAA